MSHPILSKRYYKAYHYHKGTNQTLSKFCSLNFQQVVFIKKKLACDKTMIKGTKISTKIPKVWRNTIGQNNDSVCIGQSKSYLRVSKDFLCIVGVSNSAGGLGLIIQFLNSLLYCKTYSFFYMKFSQLKQNLDYFCSSEPSSMLTKVLFPKPAGIFLDF